jgi:hypothetical protein
MPIYVIDYIFLMLRAKSVGEIIECEYKCNNWVDRLTDHNENGVAQSVTKEICGTQFKVGINLNDAFVKIPPKFTEKSIIQITDTIGLRLKSPSFSNFRSISTEGKGLFSLTDEFVFSCIESIYDGDKVLLPIKDFSLQELSDFIESFPASAIEKITEFFKNQPNISLTMKLRCPKCRNETIVELNGLDDFFD